VTGYLTILSGFSLIVSLIIFGHVFRKKDFGEILKYSIIGFIIAAIDFIVEYAGTSRGAWTYNESVYFVFDLIPIELVILFFTGGVLLRFVFLNANKITIPIKLNTILYILILIMAILYAINSYLGIETTVMSLSVMVGLWGLFNISDKNKKSAILVAIFVAVVDFVTEVIIIGSGSYDYINGFSIDVPVVYGLFTLGMLALIEKFDKKTDVRTP